MFTYCIHLQACHAKTKTNGLIFAAASSCPQGPWPKLAAFLGARKEGGKGVVVGASAKWVGSIFFQEREGIDEIV